MADQNPSLDELISGVGNNVAEDDTQQTITMDEETEEPVEDGTNTSTETDENIVSSNYNTITVEDDELEGQETDGTTASNEEGPEEDGTSTTSYDGTSGEELNEFHELAKELTNSEILPLEDEQLNNIQSAEDLKEAFKDSKNKSVNEQLTELDKQSYGAISHFMNGGNFNDFVNQNQNAGFTPYNEDTLSEDENAQKSIVKKYWQETTKWSDEKIDKKIENITDLENEALDANKRMKEIDDEKKSKIEEDNKKKQKEVQEEQDKFVQDVWKEFESTDEFIPGSKLRKDTKEKIFNGAEQTVKKVNDNWPQYLTKLAILDHYGILDGDFSKVIQQGETKANSNFEKALKGKKKQSSGSGGKKSGGEDKISALKKAARESAERNKKK